jgi:hypothetical protein
MHRQEADMTPRISARFRSTTLRYAALGLALAIGLGIALSALPAGAAPVYDPLNVISIETWRNPSMSQADIQAFLEAPLPGEGPSVLAAYSCPEAGPSGTSPVVKRASQIIFEACQAYSLNPRVLLATMEKEQSLITQHAHTSGSHSTAYHIKYALGVGVYAGSHDMHPGFGDQVWQAAIRLGTFPAPYDWTPGDRKYVHSYPDSAKAGPGADVHIWIVPTNNPTWALYIYTPYYPQISFWNYYVKFFGDPLAPPRLKPIYEFLNKRTNSFFYTSSEAQRYQLTKDSRNWTYRGAAMSTDASAPLNTVPLYRLKNLRTSRYILTASTAERDSLLRQTYRRKKVYSLQGVVAYVSMTPESGATPVYRLYNKYRNSYYYTTSAAKRDSCVREKGFRKWKYQGIAFYLGAYTPPAPTP